MRRNYSAKPLKGVIQKWVLQMGLQNGMEKAVLRNIWLKSFGKTVENQTAGFNFRNGTVFITVTSPVLRNELFALRSKLVDRFNEECGKNIVQEVRIS